MSGIFRKKSSITSTILNIAGMAFAFAALYIIMVQVSYDLSYNKKVKDSERIFIIAVPDWSNPDLWMTTIARPMWEDAIANIPCVEAAGTGYFGTSNQEHFSLDPECRKNISLSVNQISFGALNTLGFEAVSGNFEEFSDQSVIISESKARELEINAGDIIYQRDMNGSLHQIKIAAIFKDLQKNSDFSDFDCLYNLGNNSIDDPREWSFRYFVKLYSADDKETFENAANKKIEDDYKELHEKFKCTLFPLRKMAYDKTVADCGRKINLTTTYTLLVLAVLIIAIAFINYINFFFALVPVRLRSVNTRKILGASRAALTLGIVCESVLTIVAAIISAAILVGIFNSSPLATLLPSSAEFHSNAAIALACCAGAIIISIAASLHPGLYITSFSPAFALKGSLGAANKGKAFRYGLIGFQFTVSIVLIICAVFVSMQRKYMLDFDMGFNKANLLEIPTTFRIGSQEESISPILLENPSITDVTWSSGIIVAPSRMRWGRDLGEEKFIIDCYPVKYNFLKFMGIGILEGRDFMKSDEQSENGVIILNQTAKEKYNLTLESAIPGHKGDCELAGFCKDFNYMPLSKDIEPLGLYIFGKDNWRTNNVLYIRTAANADIDETIKYIKKVLHEADPVTPEGEIDVKFFDHSLNSQYVQERRVSYIILIFTVLAIIISLMGIFGLVMFEAEYRRKEIALRRVNGASVSDILTMFSRHFSSLVIISFVVAAPIAWAATDYYLSGFSERVPLHWWVFAATFAAVLCVTLAVAVIRCWNAATEDPSKTLRRE